MDALGNVIAATVSLSLKEYVKENEVDSQQQEAKKNAFATGDKQPATKSTRVNPTPCNTFVSRQMSLVQTNGAKVDGYMRTYRVGSDSNVYALSAIAIIKSESTKLMQKVADPAYACINGNNAIVTAWDKINKSADSLTITINKNEAQPFAPDLNGIALYNTTLQAGIKGLQAAVSKNLQANAIRK